MINSNQIDIKQFIGFRHEAYEGYQIETIRFFSILRALRVLRGQNLIFYKTSVFALATEAEAYPSTEKTF